MTQTQKQKLFSEYTKINKEIMSLRLGEQTEIKSKKLIELMKESNVVASKIKETGEDSPAIYYRDVDFIDNRLVYTPY